AEGRVLRAVQPQHRPGVVQLDEEPRHALAGRGATTGADRRGGRGCGGGCGDTISHGSAHSGGGTTPLSSAAPADRRGRGNRCSRWIPGPTPVKPSPAYFARFALSDSAGLTWSL